VLRIRIWDPVPFWPLDPGSGIGFFRIPDLRSQIPNPYFRELSDNVLSKKFFNSLKISLHFFLQHFKNKILFSCVKFVASKHEISYIFSTFAGHFCPAGSGFGSWSTDLIESGSNPDPDTDPDPKPFSLPLRDFVVCTIQRDGSGQNKAHSIAHH
jgi:hypothetical protein